MDPIATILKPHEPEEIKDCPADKPSGDCISRQAVIDAFHYWFADGFEEDRWWNSTHVLAAIEGLPSVEKEQEDELKAKIKTLGEEMRITQKSIADEKVLIGFNMALALCNKHIGGNGKGAIRNDT